MTKAQRMFEVFVGSEDTMLMVAARGVVALNPKTHRWHKVSKTAQYKVERDKLINDDDGGTHWTATLFSNEDLHSVAHERGLIL